MFRVIEYFSSLHIFGNYNLPDVWHKELHGVSVSCHVMPCVIQ